MDLRVLDFRAKNGTSDSQIFNYFYSFTNPVKQSELNMCNNMQPTHYVENCNLLAKTVSEKKCT